uniref:Uncharacterized protein n=1 Tax=Coptotermes formosanus TaxID=36987 RepID=R4V1T8_COPFO|nr:hypothetical protein [Coptotermes formosanus]
MSQIQRKSMKQMKRMLRRWDMFQSQPWDCQIMSRLLCTGDEWEGLCLCQRMNWSQKMNTLQNHSINKTSSYIRTVFIMMSIVYMKCVCW